MFKMINRLTQGFSKFKFQLSTFLVFLALWVIFIVANPRAFLGIRTYSALMTTIPFTIIVALASTLVITCGEIDLSFPSIMGLSAWIFASISLLMDELALAVFISLVIGLIAGLLNGVLVAKIGIPSIAVTLGTMFFWRGVILVGSQGWGIPLLGTKGSTLYNVLVGEIGFIPVQALWAIAFAFFFWLFLNRHKFGAHIYYTGDNKESARLMGVSVDRIKIIVFTQMSVVASLAGIMVSLSILNFYPTCGEGYLLKTIAAVFLGGTSVFGGTGSIFGTFIGAIIIVFLETGILAAGFAGFWTQLIYGFIIIVSLIAQVTLRR